MYLFMLVTSEEVKARSCAFSDISFRSEISERSKGTGLSD